MCRRSVRGNVSTRGSKLEIRTYSASDGISRYAANFPPRSYASVDGESTSTISRVFRTVCHALSSGSYSILPQMTLTSGYTQRC